MRPASPVAGPTPESGVERERRSGPGERGDSNPAVPKTITFYRRPACAGESWRRPHPDHASSGDLPGPKGRDGRRESRDRRATPDLDDRLAATGSRGIRLSNSSSRRWQTRPRAAAATKKAPSGAWHGRGSRSTLEVTGLRSARCDTSRARYRPPIPPRRQIGRARLRGREAREA